MVQLKHQLMFGSNLFMMELLTLLKRSNKIKCITPIRKFENFYYSYAKTRHFTTKVEQKALNDLWEHWRHKVVDYLILKKERTQLFL